MDGVGFFESCLYTSWKVIIASGCEQLHYVGGFASCLEIFQISFRKAGFCFSALLTEVMIF